MTLISQDYIFAPFLPLKSTYFSKTTFTFFPMISFDPPETENLGFSDVFREIEREHWKEKS